MAHNGGFGELTRLDEQLGQYASLMLGDTDSERYFALITQQADAHGGDVGAGIAASGGNFPRRRGKAGPLRPEFRALSRPTTGP
jgi:hypothetical protein